MRRYVLLEVTGDGGYDAGVCEGSPVRLVAEGSAAQCLLAAAEELPAAVIADVRLVQLPAVHRRVGAAEAAAAGAN